MIDDSRLKDTTAHYRKCVEVLKCCLTDMQLGNQGRAQALLFVKRSFNDVKSAYTNLMNIREELGVHVTRRDIQYQVEDIEYRKLIGRAEEVLGPYASSQVTSSQGRESVVQAASLFSKQGRENFNDTALNLEIFMLRMRKRIKECDQSLSIKDHDEMVEWAQLLRSAFQEMVGPESLERQHKTFKVEEEKYHRLANEIGFGVSKLKENFEL